jgi:CMP-N,N'-diacetyllegionaminic acid synthase
MISALIPARSGSKGVLGKNIKLLNGYPLIHYAIDAAKKCPLINSVVVSTDSKEIADIAKSCGAEVIMRPKNIAEDQTPMLPVIEHALTTSYFKSEDLQYLILLQPTCPLRDDTDITQAINLAIKEGADSVVSVYEVGDCHPGRMYSLSNKELVAYDESLTTINRQDLPKLFHRNGAIYITTKSAIENGSLYGKKIVPYIMSKNKSLNIDDQYDWEIAEYLIKKG